MATVLLGFGVGVLYLLFVTFWPGFAVETLLLVRDAPPGSPVGPPDCRSDVGFEVDGTPIHAWLYLPAQRHATPGFPASS